MMDTILILYNECKKLVERNIPVSVIRKTGIFDEVIRMKYAIGNDDSEGFEKLVGKIYEVLNKISDDYGTQERKSLL